MENMKKKQQSSKTKMKLRLKEKHAQKTERKQKELESAAAKIQVSSSVDLSQMVTVGLMDPLVPFAPPNTTACITEILQGKEFQQFIAQRSMEWGINLESIYLKKPFIYPNPEPGEEYKIWHARSNMRSDTFLPMVLFQVKKEESRDTISQNLITTTEKFNSLSDLCHSKTPSAGNQKMEDFAQRLAELEKKNKMQSMKIDEQSMKIDELQKIVKMQNTEINELKATKNRHEVIISELEANVANLKETVGNLCEDSIQLKRIRIRSFLEHATVKLREKILQEDIANLPVNQLISLLESNKGSLPADFPENTLKLLRRDKKSIYAKISQEVHDISEKEAEELGDMYYEDIPKNSLKELYAFCFNDSS